VYEEQDRESKRDGGRGVSDLGTGGVATGRNVLPIDSHEAMLVKWGGAGTEVRLDPCLKIVGVDPAPRPVFDRTMFPASAKWSVAIPAPRFVFGKEK